MKFVLVLVLQQMCSLCFELSHYEDSEELPHEDQRSVARDTKTVFRDNWRCKRQDEPVFDSDDFRIFDEEHVNLTDLGILPGKWPEIRNSSNEGNLELEDKSVLQVEVNISRLQSLKDHEEECASLWKKQQIFWHNQMSKEQIRKLQSNF